MLRTLLHRALQDDDVERLAQAAAGAPQRAFASSSLRPFLIAALLESAPFRDRPALIVASDDRMARDLALDLRAFRAPAPVRFYPARGVRYESHLAPPPHLVGLRIAALDSLLEPPAGEAPVVVASAVALMERIPDPDLRPHGFTIAVGEELDLDETLERLVACGYEREEQVAERGQFAVRGGILDVYPATEERAVRVELFGDEVESLRWFSTFTQRSLEDAERVEIAPAAELDAGVSRARRDGGHGAGWQSGPTSRRCCPWTTSAPSWSWWARTPPCWWPPRRSCGRRSPTTGRTSPPASTPTTRTTSTSRPSGSARRSRSAPR